MSQPANAATWSSLPRARRKTRDHIEPLSISSDRDPQPGPRRLARHRGNDIVDCAYTLSGNRLDDIAFSQAGSLRDAPFDDLCDSRALIAGFEHHTQAGAVRRWRARFHSEQCIGERWGEIVASLGAVPRKQHPRIVDSQACQLP